VDNIKSVEEVAGIKIDQALIGTCTNGRIEDLRAAAKILKGHKVKQGVQLLIAPASRKVYRQAMKEGLVEIFLAAGGNILSPSCGPCLGTGQGIPADDSTVISTANRNFLGRMGNKQASIYLASPVTVAQSALEGAITTPAKSQSDFYPYIKTKAPTVEIRPGDNRRIGNVWEYVDADNLNTDQMFAGNLTYEINSSEPDKIAEHLLTGFDKAFAENVERGDILMCGENFGCGSSREHPAVGFAYVGVRAIVAKSVSRIFYRSAINQGLPIIVAPKAVAAYKPGDKVSLDLKSGILNIEEQQFKIPVLPPKLMQILEKGGLVNWISTGGKKK
jgi:3-isopropylmalate dehydratase small subunit